MFQELVHCRVILNKFSKILFLRTKLLLMLSLFNHSNHLLPRLLHSGVFLPMLFSVPLHLLIVSPRLEYAQTHNVKREIIKDIGIHTGLDSPADNEWLGRKKNGGEYFHVHSNLILWSVWVINSFHLPSWRQSINQLCLYWMKYKQGLYNH